MFQVNLRRLPIIKEEILENFFGEGKNLILDYSCPLARKPSMIQRTNLYRLSIDLSAPADSQTVDGEQFNSTLMSIFDELLKVGYNLKTPSSGCFHT